MNNMRLNPRYLIAAALLAAAPCTIAQTTDYVTDNVFTQGIEGPAVDAQGNLYAVSFGKDGTIGIIDKKDNAQLFVTLPEGSTGNGIRFDSDGFMYVADYTGHQVLRIDPRDRSVGVFATLPGAHQPNDIAFAPNGMFYASDPDWRTGTGQLWRILPYGKATLLETGMGTTNGVEVGPKGDVLYVNESVQRRVWAYDLDGSGEISGKRLLIAFDDHGLDGMRTDSAGNLYIARYGAGTVAVVSPQGELLREVKLKGQKPTNVAFGGPEGRTVFVTLQDRGAIEAFRVAIPGRETGL